MNTNTKGKTKMKKTIRSLFSAALALAAMFTAGSAWAATPVAVWDGDFADGSTHGDYTVSLNGNSEANGVVTITGSKGIRFYNNGKTNNQRVTIIAKYENLSAGSANQAMVTFGGGNNLADVTSNPDYIGLYAKATSLQVNGIWNNVKWNEGNTTYSKGNFAENGQLAFAYDYSAQHTKGYLDGVIVYDASTKLQGNQIYVHYIGVGGEYQCAGIGSASNLKICAVAIFDEELDKDAIAAFKWPTKWIGGEGNWSDATKWSNGVPAANQVAVIPEGAVVTVDGTIASGVAVQGAGTLKYVGTGNTLPSMPAGITTANGGWTGTVWLSGYGTGNGCGFNLNNFGNARARFSSATALGLSGCGMLVKRASAARFVPVGG